MVIVMDADSQGRSWGRQFSGSARDLHVFKKNQ